MKYLCNAVSLSQYSTAAKAKALGSLPSVKISQKQVLLLEIKSVWFKPTFSLHSRQSSTILHFRHFSSSHSRANRPADAEPGPHSKTAGVQVSQLINTKKNYLPGPDHISFFSNTHRERLSREPVFHNGFIKYTPAAFSQTSPGHRWTSAPGQKLRCNTTGT